MRKDERLEQTMKEAWIGDAVLCLYARSKILLEDGLIESDKFERLTSNRFLGALGEAGEVEAQIGRVYQRDGLAAAFEWMEERLLPEFRKQERNRQKREGN